jgi:hypothetical protein
MKRQFETIHHMKNMKRKFKHQKSRKKRGDFFLKINEACSLIVREKCEHRIGGLQRERGREE